MLVKVQTNLEKTRQRLQKIPSFDANRHRYIFTGSTAILAAAFTYFVTHSLPYYPVGWQALLVIIVGITWLWMPVRGMALALAICILPVSATLGLGSFGLIGTISAMLLLMVLFNPYSFLLTAATIVLAMNSPHSPLIFMIPLALGFLGTSRAVFSSALTAITTTLIMMSRGITNASILAGSTTSKSIMAPLAHPVKTLLDFKWIQTPADPSPIAVKIAGKIFPPFIDNPLYFGQIALWAIVAGIIAAILHTPLTKSLPRSVQAILSGTLALVAGNIVLLAVLGHGPVDWEGMLIAAIFAAALVMLFAPVLDVLPSALDRNHPTLPHLRSFPSLSSNDTGDQKGSKFEDSTKRQIPPDTWDDLAGIDDIKKEIQDAIESQFDAKIRKMLLNLGVEPTRGILLFGPPGTGKTKIARVIAHEASASFFAVSGTEFTSKWYGESESNLRRIFDEARQNRPAVLFFDELEAFLPKRADIMRADSPEKGIISTFLSYTDGLGDLDGVLLVGATNYPNLIDPAALRPPRFDKLIYITAPDKEGRLRIFERYLKGKTLAQDVDLEKIAARSERYTGADIQSICSETIRRSLEHGAGTLAPITMTDLETALNGSRPTVTIKMQREYEAMAEEYGRRSERPDRVDVVERPTFTWDDVVGLSEVKVALHEAIELPLTNPDIFKEYGVKPSKGVLLFGPPGCGKTFLAKVVASASHASFIQVRGPELLRGLVGESESQLRDIFIRARENTPCVLFFDELDALATARGSFDHVTQIVTQFLTEMDGVDELKGVIVVGATNRPDTIDSALLRPGRFDRILYIPPPDFTARVDLLRKEMSKRLIEQSIDYELLAQMLEGYSGADITGICNAVAMTIARQAIQNGERKMISTQHLQAQIARTPRSISSEDLAMFEDLRDHLQR